MTEKAALFACDEQAPENHLKWLRLEGVDENIPAAEGMYYDLTFDERGMVYPAVVLRDAEGAPIGGACMSPDELMSLAKWGFQNCLAHSKWLSESEEGTLFRSHVTEQLKGLLDFVRAEMPEPYVELIAKDSQDVVNVRVAAYNDAIDASARKRIESERKELERSHARSIVQLSKAMTCQTPEEREEALSDPVLQSVIVKAVQTVADTNSAA